MKSITKKLLSMIICALLVFALMCGCSAAADKESGMNDYSDAVPGGPGDGVVDTDGSDLSQEVSEIQDRKLIRTVDIYAETKKFDKAISSIEAAIKKTGGYIQQQSILSDIDDARSTTMTLRIPAEKLDAFLSEVNESVRVTSQRSNVDDVTETYIDIESRIASLETEQAALMAMLEKAEKLEDVIAIQGRLTEVRGSLESYKARKKSYDTLIDYSTVNLYIDEVERETPENSGFWSDAGNAFSTGLSVLGKMLRGIGIFLVGATPFLAVMGVTAIVVIIIVKKSVKKRRQQKESDNKEEI